MPKQLRTLPVLLAVLLIIGNGCAGGDRDGPAAAPDLEAGLIYQVREFDPVEEIDVPPRWRLDADSSAYLQLSKPTGRNRATYADDRVLAIDRIEEVFDDPLLPVDQQRDPETTHARPAPRDLAGWIDDLPYVRTTKLRSRPIAGTDVEWFAIDVETPPRAKARRACASDSELLAKTEGVCLVWARTDGQPFGLWKGSRIEAASLERGDDHLFVLVAAPPKEFDSFRTEALDVLRALSWA